MDHLKMYFLLKKGTFHCHVSLPEGSCFSQNNFDRRSSSLEAVLSLDDEEFDGEADKSMAFGGLWTGVTEDLHPRNLT